MPSEQVVERKLVTVLFADLVGSTALADGEDPERVRARLDLFYSAMAEEIDRAGGTVEKFAGDPVMAVFGAPAAQEDHAERALHAALAMQHRLGELFGDELALRIGVNTGEVVVGAAREGSSFVTGDAVNVAARLEQAAGAGEILAGERTAAAVRGAFELDDPRALTAKGKAAPVQARAVLRALRSCGRVASAVWRRCSSGARPRSSCFGPRSTGSSAGASRIWSRSWEMQASARRDSSASCGTSWAVSRPSRYGARGVASLTAAGLRTGPSARS